MRWLVGLDLRERSSGTVHVAAWLRDRGAVAQSFVGVHIVDDGVRHSGRIVSEVVHAADDRLRVIAEHAGVPSPFETLRVMTATTAEDGIAQLVETEHHDAVMIGRAAPAEGHAVRRLGRVARRLLRRLPAPVMVVPPYLTREDIGRGPILLATDLGTSSVAAARFAKRIADEQGRGLVVLHVDAGYYVVPDPLGEGVTFTPAPRAVASDVVQWAEQQGLAPATTALVAGTVPDGVIAHAHLVDAPLVVCGSRRLSLVERIFASSTASDLARWCDRPVVVVALE
jgi:nucleotide-binding universal stress UspA family protein